jgi:hypothetical protein
VWGGIHTPAVPYWKVVSGFGCLAEASRMASTDSGIVKTSEIWKKEKGGVGGLGKGEYKKRSAAVKAVQFSMAAWQHARQKP